jgi:hypothetical protein
MSDLLTLFERFRRGPELVAAVLTGAAGSEVDYHPAEGKWSVREIVAHLCDAEIATSFRVRRIIAEDNPQLDSWDQDKWVANLDYAKRKPSQSLETFRRLRAENYELLKDQPEAVFSREGKHPEHGSLTLLQLIDMNAGHAEAHAQQIRSTRDAFKVFKSTQQ